MPVHQLTIDDLRRIMRECAGEDESVNLDSDILDVDFTDLGYDSLALLEAAGRVARDYGVRFSDEAVSGATNPRAFLDLVNSSLAGVG